MPIFDEAAAVEAPKEGSPEYLVMVCQQHMAWLTVYAEGMTPSDWRDMQDRLVSQIGRLKTDFAALAALLGGWRTMESAPKDETMILACGSDGVISIVTWANGGGPGASSNKKDPDGFYCAANGAVLLDEGWDDGAGWKLKPDTPLTHWTPLPASPDKGGE